METPAAPKGTRDFYPEDVVMREHIFSAWRKTCVRYGFEYFDAPAFEHLELYTQKSGPEIEKQLYTFTDKGDRSMALRPELTPSLARMVAAKGSALKHPTRWYSIPRLFRYERMQKGRLREFFQLNMDILGIAEPSADAELICAAIDTMRDLGLDNRDFSVHISSRTIHDELLSFFGVGAEKKGDFFAVLDKRNKISDTDFRSELNGIVGNESTVERLITLFDTASLDDCEAVLSAQSPAIAELRKVLMCLDEYGFSDYVKLDLSIVRGLAYYTGIVFEFFDNVRSMRAIAGGGRYNKLVELYGGPPTPAVGFAAGDVVLADLLTAKGLVPVQPPRSDVFVAFFGETDRGEAVKLSRSLRDHGISVEYSLKTNNIGKQLKVANSARSRVAVMVGGTEGEIGKFKIKSMGSGEELLVDKGDVLSQIKKLIGD